MSDINNKDIQIPVIVNTVKNGFTVDVPDLNISVNGASLLEALGRAISYCSSIYYYNLDRNYMYKLNTTYEEASKLCKGKSSFVTFIALIK